MRTKGINHEYAIRCVGPGWSSFIKNLYQAKPSNVRVTQVKEKYGSLRFYVESAPEWYFDLISYYERESETTCEICGEKGEIRPLNSWLTCLCDKHYNERLNNENPLPTQEQT